MTLQETLSTWDAMKKRRNKEAEVMSEEDYEDVIESIRALNLPDVKV